jgi:Ricin-type beta-trefoil lectin domain-like/Alpha-lytic protease prodomain
MHMIRTIAWTGRVAGVLALTVLGANSATPGTAWAGPNPKPDTNSSLTATAVLTAEAARGEALELFRDDVKAKLGDRFAGITREGETTVIRMKGTVSAEERQRLEQPLKQKVPTANVAYRAAAHSRAELDAAVAAMTRDFARLRQQLTVHSVGVDESANQLVVGVDAGSLARARTTLPARYGGVPMRFEAQTPTINYARHDSPGVFKAGLRIDVTNGMMYIGSCTSAFSFRDGNGYRRALTAGHCITWGDVVSHGSVNVGFPTQRQYGGDLDVGMFSVFPTSSPWLYRSDDWLEPIYGTRTAYRGESVCFSGAGSGYRCGSVALTNVTTTSQLGQMTVILTGMDATNAIGQPGDSGAPVYISSSGIGVVSGGNWQYTYYTPIRRVMDRWGLRLIGNDPKDISPRHSGKCLDSDLSNLGNGSLIQQWTCWGGSNQTFFIEPVYLGGNRWSDEWAYLRLAHNGRCVDFHLGMSYDGGIVQQWDCWGSYGQQFKFVPNTGGIGSPEYMLRARNNDRCIDINLGVPDIYANGVKAQQWGCWGGLNQTFRLFEHTGF